MTPRRIAPDVIDERTDRQLVLATRAGDLRAFDALFYRYKDGIFRVGLAITKDPSHAEEIVVDTFARAFRAIERLEPEDSLRPWLYRVAVNLSYNRQPRKRGPRRRSRSGRSSGRWSSSASIAWGPSTRSW